MTVLDVLSFNGIRFVATYPSCTWRPAGKLNFSEYCPLCAASFVTTVFSNPLFNNPSFPPFGGNQ